MAKTGEAVAVKVEMEGAKSSEIAAAEVQLPDGVQFYSRNHPEWGRQHELTFALEASIENSRFPFVIQSNESGTKVVRIRFLDSDGHVAQEL